MKQPDLTGQTFGEWTALHYHDGRHWWCRCSCGVEKPVRRTHMLNGTNTMCKSCSNRKRNTKHGRSGGRYTFCRNYLYTLWSRIKQKCYNPNHKQYYLYGARGICLHEEWHDDYAKFEEYVISTLGPRCKGLSLDRIDNMGNYEPGNLRWADAKQQAANRRPYGTAKTDN